MAEEGESRVVQISATVRGFSRDGTVPTPRETENSKDEEVDNGEE